jgi:hypothetical protein
LADSFQVNKLDTERKWIAKDDAGVRHSW